MTIITTTLRAIEESIREQGLSFEELVIGSTGVELIERELGRALPEAVREFLLESKLPEYSSSYGMLEAKDMLRLRRQMNEHLKNGTFADGRIEERASYFDPQPEIGKVWWSMAWLPFAEDGCGNMYCLDLAPPPTGTAGQIVHMEIQRGEPGPSLRFRSVEAFVHATLRAVQTEQAVVAEDDEYCGVDFTELRDDGLG